MLVLSPGSFTRSSSIYLKEVEFKKKIHTMPANLIFHVQSGERNNNNEKESSVLGVHLALLILLPHIKPGIQHFGESFLLQLQPLPSAQEN
jgi:hypothetical protein